jgi:hypothetical protein
MQRNEDKENNERSKIGYKHDGIIYVLLHGQKSSIGFIEVTGNVFNEDLSDIKMAPQLLRTWRNCNSK